MVRTKKIICAFGSFDIVHPGHLAYLRAASKQGSTLVVVITPDRALRTYKGYEPIFSQRERVQIISALRVVNRVVIGDSDGSWDVLRRIRPSLIYFGYDQKLAVQSLLNSSCYQAIGSPTITIGRPYRAKRNQSNIIKSKIINLKS